MEKKIYRMLWLLWATALVSLLLASLLNHQWLFAVIFAVIWALAAFWIKGWGDNHLNDDDDDAEAESDDDELSNTALVLRKIWANRSAIYITMFAIAPTLLPGKTVLRLAICFVVMAVAEFLTIKYGYSEAKKPTKPKKTGARKAGIHH